MFVIALLFFNENDVFSFRQIFTYNSNGKLTSQLTQEWDHVNG